MPALRRDDGLAPPDVAVPALSAEARLLRGGRLRRASGRSALPDDGVRGRRQLALEVEGEVPLGLDDLDELPSPRAELVELPLGARLQPHAEHVVLEAARRVLVTVATFLLEPRPVVSGPQETHDGTLALAPRA